MQSKKKSFLEALTSTIVGFIITIICSPIIYNICDVKIEYKQIGFTTILFTILSIIRGYIIRRFFNKDEINNTKKEIYKIKSQIKKFK